MSWAMELSPAGFDGMFADLAMMDRKTGRAYLQLLGYLRRFGSVPSGERALASVLGVTVRFLREVAWPLLEDRLVLSEDRRRYSSPEATRDDRSTPKPAVPPEISEVRSAAAKSSHEKRRARASGPADESGFASQGDANGVQNPANGVQNPAKVSAKSMAVAPGLHTFADDFASDLAPAPKPTLASFPSSQPAESLTGSEEVSGSEVVGARASAGDPALQTIVQTAANGHAKPDAKPPANGHAKPPANRAPGRSRMTADWQPAAAVSDYCANLLGGDLAETLEAFRDHFLANGETKLDWGAALRGWCRRKMDFDAQRRQMPLVRTIGGSKPDKGAFLDRERERIQARWAARDGGDNPNDGPIIEGVAS